MRQIQLGVAPGPKGKNVVEGNFIGLDATGTNSLASAGSGVFVQTPTNRIGGATPGARNLISGQGTTGIEIFEAFASGNVVQGNYIGTDRTGTKAIGNTDRALVVNMNAFGNTIGGTAPGAGNVISGNLNRGITLDGSNNVVQGNFIGTDVTGLNPLGNARTGVEISGPGNTVGGTNSGAGNVIAFNGVDGGGVFTTNGVDVSTGRDRLRDPRQLHLRQRRPRHRRERRWTGHRRLPRAHPGQQHHRHHGDPRHAHAQHHLPAGTLHQSRRRPLRLRRRPHAAGFHEHDHRCAAATLPSTGRQPLRPACSSRRPPTARPSFPRPG